MKAQLPNFLDIFQTNSDTPSIQPQARSFHMANIFTYTYTI